MSYIGSLNFIFNIFNPVLQVSGNVKESSELSNSSLRSHMMRRSEASLVLILIFVLNLLHLFLPDLFHSRYVLAFFLENETIYLFLHLILDHSFNLGCGLQNLFIAIIEFIFSRFLHGAINPDIFLFDMV